MGFFLLFFKRSGGGGIKTVFAFVYMQTDLVCMGGGGGGGGGVHGCNLSYVY